MEFNKTLYKGVGLNHDKEEVQGVFEVHPIAKTDSYRYTYIATRTLDGLKVHEEAGMFGKDEQGHWILNVHMEEMPCHTQHRLAKSTDNTFDFRYRGTGKIEGFNSELVFEFSDDGFRYLHRWAMGGEVSDKSWCDLV